MTQTYEDAPTSEENDDTGADFAVRLLIALVRSGKVEVLRRALPEALPWADFLPPEDAEELLDDLMHAVAEAQAAPPHNLAPVSALLKQWKHNATAYADPALYAILTDEYLRPEDGLAPVPG